MMCHVRSDNITCIEVHHGILFDRLVQITSNLNELSMDVKKVKNVKSFTEKLYTNLIAKQNETGNFEYLLNSF